MLEQTREEAVLELEARNTELGREVAAAHGFIAAMQALAEAMEGELPDSDLMALLGRVLGDVVRVLEASDGSVLVLDEENGDLVFVLSHGDVPAADLTWRRIPAGQGIAGWVVANRAAVAVHDAQDDERFWPAVDRELAFETRSVLAAPIVAGARLLGVIEILNKRDGGRFSDTDRAMLALLGRFAGSLLARMTERDRPAADAGAAPAPRRGRRRGRGRAAGAATPRPS